MDKVIIRDLLARGIIDIDDAERERPQDILINVEITADLSIPGGSDDIGDCINYSTMAKSILRYVESARRYTVEALAEDIARLCLEAPSASRVLIRVEKPGAVRFTRSVGVEIERIKPA